MVAAAWGVVGDGLGEGMQTAAGVGGAGGGVRVDKGKGEMDAGGFGRAARVSDSSSRYSEPDGMAWKR